MSNPTHKTLSDRVAERASKLHDAAFRDPKIKPEDKPSWNDSIRAAEEQLAGDTVVEDPAPSQPEN